MKVSIVTVALNAAEELALTIESVHQQSFLDREHIVVDGGSWDGTAGVLASYRDALDRVVHLEDAGIFHAMNAALEHCTGEFVLFLNAGDTLYGREVLARIMAQSTDEIDVIFGNHVYKDGPRERLTRSETFDTTMLKLRDGRLDARWLSRIPAHQATFVRLALLKALRFDTRLAVCADHDLLLRAHARGARMRYVDEVVSLYVGGGFSQVNEPRLRLEWAAIYRRYSDRPRDVDRFFLGAAASPFPAETGRTGAWVSGVLAREDVDGRASTWCSAAGFRLRTPDHAASTGLTIEGFNVFEAQRLAVFENDRLVGEQRVTPGAFVVAFAFTDPIPPGTTLDIVPAQFGALAHGDKRQVCLSVAAFGFETSGPDDNDALASGDEITVGTAEAQRLARMLAAGWWGLENNLIWSKSGPATLSLPLSADVARIALHVSANPFLDAAQRLRVELNGIDVGTHAIGASPYEIVFDDHVRAGRRNSIVLTPSTAQQPPGDSRTLGFCLHRIEAG